MGSHLESADGKAGIRPPENCLMGCQGCRLGKVRFLREGTVWARQALHLSPGLCCRAKGVFGRLALFVFSKVIELELPFLVGRGSDTQSPEFWKDCSFCRKSHFDFKGSWKLDKRDSPSSQREDVM